jgi:hypothetical protein
MLGNLSKAALWTHSCKVNLDLVHRILGRQDSLGKFYKPSIYFPDIKNLKRRCILAFFNYSLILGFFLLTQMINKLNVSYNL